jgi:thiamine pyrophosphokinase
LRIIIFANGALNDEGQIEEIIRPDDVILAADGGVLHCLRLNLVPEEVVGDFDSLEKEDIAKLEAQGVALYRHPRRKDETDLKLALDRAMEREPDSILIFGGLGERWDMSLSNLLLLTQSDFSAPRVQFIHEGQTLSLLQAGQTLNLEGERGDTISLIPLCGDASGITTRGLEYPLDDGTLHFGSSRGVSNVIQAESARIELKEGLLLVVQIQKGALR